MKQRSSARRYLVRRTDDLQVLVEAETIWVFVDRKSGRPQRIPNELRAAFEVMGENTD